MAEEKKTTAKVIVPVKAEEKKEVKVEEKKAAPVKKAAPAKKTAPAAKKTTTAKAAATKAAEAKKEPAKKAAAPAKKAPAKKAAAPAKKAAEVSVKVEFSGKSYTTEDLVNIAKDVWKYDLNGKAEDFKTVELYVKPEESTTYYVINGDVTGSFFI